METTWFLDNVFKHQTTADAIQKVNYSAMEEWFRAI